LPDGISRLTLSAHRSPVQAVGGVPEGGRLKKMASLIRCVVQRVSSPNFSRAWRAFCCTSRKSSPTPNEVTALPTSPQMATRATAMMASATMISITVSPLGSRRSRGIIRRMNLRIRRILGI
jgi:hypothetical protein